MEETKGRLYTMREACSLLGVHPNTLRRWDGEGKIKVVRPKGGHRRIPESEITRLLTKSPAPTSQQAIPREEHLKEFLSYVFSYHRDDWELVKRAILIRDGYTCSKCGGKELLRVHHKDGTSRNDPENLVTLCNKCYQEIQKTISEPKTRKITPKSPTKPEENAKAEKKPEKASSTGELPRHAILDELAPVGLAQRTAFGDLLSATIALRSFALEEISIRARCPVPIARTFCERMRDRGYLLEKDGRYEVRVKVAR